MTTTMFDEDCVVLRPEKDLKTDCAKGMEKEEAATAGVGVQTHKNKNCI